MARLLGGTGGGGDKSLGDWLETVGGSVVCVPAN